jgi:hypothetical protein
MDQLQPLRDRRGDTLPNRNLEAEVAPLVDNTLAPEERQALSAHRIALLLR